MIGGGISGLGAAWALSRDHSVTLFEANERLGGHSNTVDVDLGGRPTAVDTGFIVYNEITYPNLTRLFDVLGVVTEASDMSFAFSRDRSFEYAASLRGVLGNPRNLIRRGFQRLLLDIDRFRRIGTSLAPRGDETIEELLRRHRFSDEFLDDYLLPMTGAIWSAGSERIQDFPARTMLDFLANHGLIEIAGRPMWRTVTGGSRNYVDLLAAPFADRVRLGSPVTDVVRAGGRVIVTTNGWGQEVYDEIILATHSDQALRILGDDATPEERESLGAIPYQGNVAVLHSDPRLMPANRRIWSSWNAMANSGGESDHASVSYWMNRLQNLDERIPLIVTLNPLTPPDPALVHAEFEYAHPQLDARAVRAQQQIARIQGHNNTWFTGAYLGYGFHEDGLQSGLNVAAALGSPAPWHGSFQPMSSAIQPEVLVR